MAVALEISTCMESRAKLSSGFLCWGAIHVKLANSATCVLSWHSKIYVVSQAGGLLE